MPVRVIAGDCRTALQELPSESVHCILTSPPYYGLRDYGTATWDGGDPACDHMEVAVGISSKNTLGRSGHLPETNAANVGRKLQFRSVCGKCGARRIDQQIGLEQTPDDYVAEIVAVFREARRVLRDDGTAWINLGDSYNTNPSTSVIPRAEQGNGSGAFRIPGQEHVESRKAQPNKATPLIRAGIKKKDLIGIPWMVAFALRADGWYLRQDNIWQKISCMPESVTDRTTRSHEYVFMFSKRSSYFYDSVAIAEPSVSLDPEHSSYRPNSVEIAEGGRKASSGKHETARSYRQTRNKRSVWTIATEPSGISHYAMMPTALAEICIKAGTSERGCCPTCAAPWSRAVEKRRFRDGEPITGSWNSATDHRIGPTGIGHWRDTQETRTVGWSQSCACPAHDPIPATILDCFAGAGTTGLVADRLGRSAILIELSETNAAMARDRLEGDAGLFAEVSAG